MLNFRGSRGFDFSSISKEQLYGVKTIIVKETGIGESYLLRPHTNFKQYM